MAREVVHILMGGGAECDDCYRDACFDDPLGRESNLALHKLKSVPDGNCERCGAVIEHGKIVRYV
jgi:hypothetical protein